MFCFGIAPLCGVQFDQFWSLTPYAFEIIIKAYNKKLADEFDIIKYQAWHIAAFTRIKKMPRYADYIKPLKSDGKPGISEGDIKASLKAYQNGQSSKS